MLRKILIAFFVVFLLFAGAAAYLFYKIRPGIRAALAQNEATRKMLHPRVVTGEGEFEKRAFYAGDGLGEISQILVGWPANREGAEIAVVGNHGTDFIDFTGIVRKQVRYEVAQGCPVVVARVEPSGTYGFLTRDESWAAPVTLFDAQGRVHWRSDGGWSGVDDSVAGDVHGDGKLSIAIGFNGDGGVALIDDHGKTVWKIEDTNVWHVEMLDTNGDGRQEILNSNAKGELVVRNESGDVSARYSPRGYVSRFTITRWDQEAAPTHILASVSGDGERCCETAMVILDAKGKEVQRLEAPMGELFTGISATPIRFQGGDSYFAVLQSLSSSDRSMLLLYSGDGQIAYQEVFNETCMGLGVFPDKGGERLLLGCAAKVWEFSPSARKGTR